jgi:hypothetical protein
MSVDEISTQEKLVGIGKKKTTSFTIPLYNQNQEIGMVFPELVGSKSTK